MSETILKRKGGRPPLPPAPQNAAECRALIAAETVKTTPRERTLRALYKLLRAMERAQDAERREREVTATEKAIALNAAELELKRKDYLLRMAKGPLAAKVIEQQRKKIEELEQRVVELETRNVGVNSGLSSAMGENVPTLTGKDGIYE